MEFTQIFPVWVNEHIGHHLPKIIKSCMSASALNIFFETLQDDTAQFSVPIRVTNHAFITWIFFTPLWRTIKNSGRAESGWGDRLWKITTKSKRNKNFKMPSFCAVFNYWNLADKVKDKSNYRFRSIVKNNGKEGLKLSKVKDLTETKLERPRTRIKIMLFASP